jgi:hypothetical protein
VLPASLLSILEAESHHFLFLFPISIYYITLCCVHCVLGSVILPIKPPFPLLYTTGWHKTGMYHGVRSPSSFTLADGLCIDWPSRGVPGKFKGCNTCRTRRVKVGILLSNSSVVVGVLMTRSVTMPGQSVRSASPLAGNVEGTRGR